MDLASVRWELGPFILTSSSLSFSAAVLAALIFTYLEARRRFLSRQYTIDFMLLALIGGLAGGRLVYAFLIDRMYYLEKPMRLVYFHEGGFSFLGGLLAAAIVVSVWSIGKKFVLERYLDSAAPALALALVIGWTGYPLQGKPMTTPYPWGIRSGTEVLHPDGVYAIIMLMIILAVIWRRRLRARYDGELFFWFTAGYSLTAAAVEHFRVVVPLWRGFSLEQLVAAAAFLLSVLYILFASKNYISPYRIYRRPSKPPSRGRRRLGNLVLLAAIAGLAALYYYLHGWPVGTDLYLQACPLTL